MPRKSWKRLPRDDRARILDAAMEEFGQHGYSGGSLAVIGHAAGLEEGWLLRYFEDRSDFVGQVAQTATRRVADALSAELSADAPQPLVEQFVRVADVWMSYMGEHPRERGATAAATMELDPQVRRIIGRPARDVYLDGMRPLVESAIHRGELRPDIDVDAVLALFALLLPYLAVAPYEPGLDMGVTLHARPVRARAAIARRLVETLLYGVAERPTA